MRSSVRREPGEVAEPVAGVLLVAEAGLVGLALEGGEGGEVRVAEQLADDEAAAGFEDAGGSRAGLQPGSGISPSTAVRTTASIEASS